MKKNWLKLIFVIVVVVILIFVAKKFWKPSEQTINTLEQFAEKKPVEWHANYIWDGTTENNQWMCFRKSVDLTENEIQNVVAQIAVDSKYWLYINGEMVIREGALKRGETMNSTYYDEVEITDYLQEGKNTIALLVWYWGDTSISHNSSGQGAMLFQAKLGDNYLVSDETWKVAKCAAYLQDALRPNSRLIEYNVYYDANLAQENWYKPDYDDTAWANGVVLGVAGSQPWGDLIERNIPQFKDYGLKEYENMADYKEYTTKKKETLAMKIPYNAQFTPYLKINAPAGKKITIKTDFYEDVSGDSVKCTYLTKEGEQEFESPAWMNGETVYYEIPAGVKVVSLGYRESGYDAEMTGDFKSDDEFFNRLWQMGNRTLYVNMRDSYMDCPNRERAQWLGDMSLEMLEAMYALDTSAYALYEKGIRTTIGWIQNENVFLTVVPDSEEGLLHLPTQALAGIHSMYQYYQYTGKKEFLEYVYPYLKNYLQLYVEQESGLVDNSSLYFVWKWGDSSGNVDYEAIENAWYYLVLGEVNKMADILGYEEDKREFSEKLKNLKESYQKLWTEKGYKTPKSDVVDERANALAVISGLAEEDKYDTITKLLTTSYDATPYMEKYVLEALCKMGKIEEGQERIKYRYDEMVNGKNSCSTLWENWDASVNTRNHAWAGGPLIIMSQYFAGIEPLEAGYDVISIKPQFGKLTKINSQVTTVKGDINLEAQKQEDTISIKIKVPSKTRVAVPKISENSKVVLNDKTIYEAGKYQKNKNVQYDSEDEQYIYFYVESGEYEFRCEKE